MFKYLNKTKQSLKDWSHNHSQGENAKLWLAIFSFTEASFFPIIADVFLLAILLGNGVRWVYYSFITTIFSVLGAAFGYLIGLLFFDLIGEFIIQTYNLQSQMLVVGEMFANNSFWAIFISAFTPIPFKVFTISAGFFKINFWIFILASILGRGMRFFAVGYLVKCFGKQMAHYAFKYFNYLTLIIFVLILLILFL